MRREPLLPLLVLHHLGLGDHLICSGLYRQLSREYSRIFFVVKKHNFQSVKDLLVDTSGITIFPLPNRIADRVQRYLKVLARALKFPHLGLGYFGSDFLIPGENIKFDENFYRQASVDFLHRWESFQISRNTDREKKVFETYSVKKGGYVFLHEDVHRGFVIDRSLINTTLPIVSPKTNSHYRFVDYLMLIENAAEIHCIESSFAALIEGMQINVPKIAHRYSRPEAKSNPRMEFTYNAAWKIEN